MCLLFDGDYDDEKCVDTENDNDGGSKDNNLWMLNVKSDMHEYSTSKRNITIENSNATIVY